MRMKMYGVQIPEELAEKIDTMCKEKDLRPSDVLRRAISTFFNNDTMVNGVLKAEMEKTIIQMAELSKLLPITITTKEKEPVAS